MVEQMGFGESFNRLILSKIIFIQLNQTKYQNCEAVKPE